MSLPALKLNDVADLRRRLIANGYTPVPVVTGDKMPKVPGWAKLTPDADQVDALLASHPDHLSTGLLCGTLVAIDVDVLDDAAAEEISDLVAAMPGAESTLVRQGQAPKTLFLFRSLEPRPKSVTPEYTINGKKAQVEVMGHGQQVVAFGRHPVTGRDYEWVSDETPLTRSFDELAEISSEEIEKFLIDAKAVLARHGTPVKNKPTEKATHVAVQGDSYWKRVNTAALADIKRWVTALFSDAKQEPGTGSWRISSASLGRSLQEDISINHAGIRDFGEDIPETPISLVMKYGGASSATEAAHWLCERLGTSSESLGWQEVIQKAPPAKLVAANDNKPRWPGVVSSGDLVRRFTPPDYSIDGIVQSGFCYSLTASTGTGKTAILLAITALKAQGLPLGNREVPQGRVIYFAGENPDDVTMRWIGLAHHTEFNTRDIDVHFVPGVFDIEALKSEVTEAVERVGGASMIIIDTSAAYFTGDDENGNVAMGKHARKLRALTTLKGSPCVLIACHPTKNADQSNLLPRGGGAFLAEVDGNLTCQKSDGGAVKLHWQGKFRGPDFEPINFELATVTAPGLVDSKGREIPTVMAKLISGAEVRERREMARKDEDHVLMIIEGMTDPSAAQIADKLGWWDTSGNAHKRRAQTALNKLRKDKLVESGRAGWSLTAAGLKASTQARTATAREARFQDSASRLIANLGG